MLLKSSQTLKKLPVKLAFTALQLIPSYIDSFYHTIKNHLFENGNKRTAVILVLLFYIHNEKWLDIDENKLYDLSLHVASSESSRKEEILNDIKTLFKQSETKKPKDIV